MKLVTYRSGEETEIRNSIHLGFPYVRRRYFLNSSVQKPLNLRDKKHPRNDRPEKILRVDQNSGLIEKQAPYIEIQ